MSKLINSALGVMLFEMTFGRSPYSFESTTVPAVIKAHRQASIEFPEPWPSSLPIVWRSILERMLSKRPESRFESFEEVGYRLYHARPHDVRKAGRLVRGLAWAVDLTICIAMVGIVIGVVTFGVDTISSTGSALNNMITVPILAACVFALPAGVGYFQARWGTTPGKKLMQIRIVDEHGLRPHRWQLVFRVVPQLLPAWALLVNGMIGLVVPESVSDTLAGGLLVITGADALPALFSTKGRSLHDWFFNTQVVLDDGRGD